MKTKQTLCGILLASLFSSPLLARAASPSPTDWLDNAIDHRFENEQPAQASAVTSNKTSRMAAMAANSTSAPLQQKPVSNEGLNELMLKRLKISTDLTAESTDLFGDAVDLATGSISFTHTDVDVPGNFPIPVAATRRYMGSAVTPDRTMTFGDWNLVIPSIQTNLVKAVSSGQYSGRWGAGTPCSGPANPGIMTSRIGSSIVELGADSYWSGDSLNLPNGQGGRIVRGPAGQTVKDWQLKCGVDAGKEYYTAVSPEGVIYTFKQLQLALMSPNIYIKGQQQQTSTLIPKVILHTFEKYQASLYVTKIEDRFGNNVVYNYDASQPGKLDNITASDGRSIQFTYSADKKRIVQVTSANKTWLYDYRVDNGVYRLSTVKRPDGGLWKFDITLGSGSASATQDSGMPPPNHVQQCTLHSSNVNERVVAKMTHPNGLNLELTAKGTVFGKSQVPKISTEGESWRYLADRCFGTMALTKKTISGPSISPMTWQYRYSQNHGAYIGDSDASLHLREISNLPYELQNRTIDLRATSVFAPDGSKTVHVFDRSYTAFEGKEVLTQQYDTDSTTLLSQTLVEYAAGNNIFEPDLYSYFAYGWSDTSWQLTERFTFDNEAPHKAYVYKSRARQYVGASLSNYYTEKFSNFNEYGQPTFIEESNSVDGSTRYTKHTYTHFKDYNIINQLSEVHVSSDNVNFVNVNKTEYVPLGTAGFYLPQHKYSFNKLVESNSYNLDGTLARVTYQPSNMWLEYSKYKRGIPEQITAPDRYNSNATAKVAMSVNDWGNITSTTDLNGHQINYSYDLMGRVTFIDPIDPTVADTSISYQYAESADTAVTQTIQRGNYRKTTKYDGLLRPRLSAEWDADNPGQTIRYTNRLFNVYGKETFVSVASKSAVESLGTTTVYDGMQRVKSQTNTANGDVRYTYHDNNRVTLTNGRGINTTTTYRAFGKYEQQDVIKIEQPEGVTTSLVLNLFSNPLTITQGGITEQRVYDASQQLCLVKRPETGIKAMVYNGYGQVSRAAEGLTGNGTSCSDYQDDAAAWVHFEYDNLGGIKTKQFSDGNTPTTSYTYDNQGNLKHLANGPVVWAYQYNSANLVEAETLTIDQKTFAIQHTYNALGAPIRTIYPDATTVSHTVNALGQITAVHADSTPLASAALYHPNGQLAEFTYGNGLVFKQSLDSQQRPFERQVQQNTSAVLLSTYRYDNNNNIESITDGIQASKSLTLRYDNLDRLYNAAAGHIGNITLGYDTLGNIRHKQIFSTTHTYHYDANTQRLASAMGYNFAYDSRGNVTGKNAQTFSYNRANQLTSSGALQYAYDGHGRRVKQLKSNQNTYSVYDLAGTLLYRGNPETSHTSSVYLGKQLLAELDSAGAAQAPAKPTISINLSTAKVRGQCSIWDLDCADVRNVYYSWGTANASSCQGSLSQTTADGSPISHIDLSGTTQISTTQSYPANDALFTLTLTCQGPGGATTESRTVAGTGSNGDEM